MSGGARVASWTPSLWCAVGCSVALAIAIAAQASVAGATARSSTTRSLWTHRRRCQCGCARLESDLHGRDLLPRDAASRPRDRSRRRDRRRAVALSGGLRRSSVRDRVGRGGGWFLGGNLHPCRRSRPRGTRSRARVRSCRRRLAGRCRRWRGQAAAESGSLLCSPAAFSASEARSARVSPPSPPRPEQLTARSSRHRTERCCRLRSSGRASTPAVSSRASAAWRGITLRSSMRSRARSTRRSSRSFSTTTSQDIAATPSRVYTANAHGLAARTRSGDRRQGHELGIRPSPARSGAFSLQDRRSTSVVLFQPDRECRPRRRRCTRRGDSVGAAVEPGCRPGSRTDGLRREQHRSRRKLPRGRRYPPRFGIARVDATSGVLDGWNPAPKRHSAIARRWCAHGDRGIRRQGLGGSPRSRLAALDATTGGLDQGWISDVDPSGGVSKLGARRADASMWAAALRRSAAPRATASARFPPPRAQSIRSSPRCLRGSASRRSSRLAREALRRRPRERTGAQLCASAYLFGRPGHGCGGLRLDAAHCQERLQPRLVVRSHWPNSQRAIAVSTSPGRSPASTASSARTSE